MLDTRHGWTEVYKAAYGIYPEQADDLILAEAFTAVNKRAQLAFDPTLTLEQCESWFSILDNVISEWVDTKQAERTPRFIADIKVQLMRVLNDEN
jgi:hypothetical protein